MEIDYPGGTGIQGLGNSRVVSWTVRPGHRLRGALLAMALAVLAAPGGAAAAAGTAGSVLAPSVALSTTAAGATGVLYTLDLTTRSALSATDTVTVVLPSGTVIPAQAITIQDRTSGATVYAGTPTQAGGPQTATWPLDTAVAAGDTLELSVPGVQNAASGPGQARLWTSTDTAPAGTSPFTLVPAQSVSTPAVHITSNAEGATGVTYAIRLRASSTGGLQSGQGTVTVSLPMGSTVPSQSIYATDLTTGSSLYLSPSSVGGNQGIWTLDSNILPGDEVEIPITGVTNASGDGSVAVATSSDTLAGTSAPLGLAPARAVTNATLTPSTPALGATGVTYSLDMTTSSSGGLDAGNGTVTVALPSGTTIPSTPSSISGTDLTTGKSIYLTSKSSANNGATGTYTTGYALPAGHRFVLQITGVSNPASAPTDSSTSVSTSSDTVTKAASSISYVPAARVNSLTVFPSTPVRGASAVTYEATFSPSKQGGLVSGDTITMSLPSGGAIAQGSARVTDLETGASFGLNWASGTGSSATWMLYSDLPAGHRLELEAYNVTNPSSGAVTITTSSDTSPGTSTPNWTAPGSVGGLDVTPSTVAAGATGVGYTVNFTTSATGRLAASQGTVTVTLPSGTTIASGQTISGRDLSNGSPESFSPVSVNGNVATWRTANTIPVAHDVELNVPGVTNGGAGTGGSVTVQTSSDTAPSSSPFIKFGTASAVSPLTVTPSSTAAGATATDYRVQFITSPTGGLAGAGPYGLSNADRSAITLSLPAGSVIPANEYLTIRDLTTNQQFNGNPLDVTNSGATASWEPARPIAAGDRVDFTVTGVANTTGAGGGITLKTSADTVAASDPQGLKTSAAQTVLNPTIAISNQAASATGSVYSLDFTTSATGALATTGTITVGLGAGSNLSNAYISVVDLTTGHDFYLNSYPSSTANGGATATYGQACNSCARHRINGGDRVRVILRNVANPPAGSYTATIATSADNASPAANVAYGIGSVGAPTAPTSVILSSNAEKAGAITYRVVFTADGSGVPQGGGITIGAPSGTTLPGSSIDVYDITAAQDLGTANTAGASGNTVTYNAPAAIPPNHQVQLTVDGVSNPAAGTGLAIAISAGSGKWTTNTYDIVAASAPSAATLLVSNPVQAVGGQTNSPGTGVTYGITFTTSPAGGISAAGGTVTITLPSGTTIPQNYYDVYDETAGEDLNSTGVQPTAGYQAVLPIRTGIPAGHQILLTLTNVANTITGGGGTGSVTTSSDTGSASLAVPLQAAQPPAVSATVSDPVAGAGGVSYRFDLTSSSTGALAAYSGAIYLTLPSGSTVPSQSVELWDATAGVSLGSGSLNVTSGNQAKLSMSSYALPAGHRARFVLTGVTSSSTPGSNAITVSTSSDSSVQTTVSLIAAGAPTGVAATASSPVAGATGVTWQVGVQTSTNGELEAGFGSLSVTLPSGATIPQQGIDIHDLTTGITVYAYYVSGSANAMTWRTYSDVGAGDQLLLLIPGVTNPTTADGVTVHTSSDTTDLKSATVALSSASAVLSPTVSVSTSAQGAHGVDYLLDFTTSASGRLVGGQGSFTVTLPAGSVLTTGYAYVYDVTGHTDLGYAYAPTGSNAGKFQIYTDLPAGHQFRVRIPGVTNAGTGDVVKISTTSDPVTAQTSTLSLTPIQPVSGAKLTLSSAAQGASGVTAWVDFTTSSTGGLLNQGKVSLALPTGMVLPGGQCVDTFDITAHLDLGSACPTAYTTSSATWSVPDDVPAGHAIRLTLTNVTNGTTSGNATVSTSSDSAATPAVNLVAPSAPTELHPPVLASPGAAATGALSEIFATSANGTLTAQGRINLTAPAGTTFSYPQVQLFDLTAGTDLGSVYAQATGNQVSIGSYYSYSVVRPGHLIRITLSNVTNPPAGNAVLHLSTTSDPLQATSPQYTVGTPTALAGPAVALGSATPGAGGVTYTLQAGATSGLAAGDTLTAFAPTGTGWGGAAATILDTKSGGSGTTAAPALSDGGSTATWTIPSGFTAASGDPVKLTVPGVGNPVGGLYEIQLVSSRDTAPAQVSPYSIANAPTVSSVSPSAGPVAGGTSVTISGSGFSGASSVSFGTTPAASFSVLSDSSITATSPAGSAGPVDVTVAGPGGTSARSAADRFTFAPVPAVSSLSPGAGPAAGGNTVKIFGHGFSTASAPSAVMFGSAAARSYSVVSDTEIDAVAPSTTAGSTVDVVVTTPGGTSASGTTDRYTYDAPPTVTGINPATGPTAGGTAVTITGTNFVNGATTVAFGGTPATQVTFTSSTSLTATSPAGSGTVDVRVTTPGGASTTNAPADRFTYTSPPPPAPAPAVAGVSPGSGPAAGGTSVTISGSGFASGATVSFGGSAASSVSVNGSTSITATSPAGSGTVDVVVTNADGQSSAATSADRFTYTSPAPPPPAPAVAGVSPGSGPAAGGTSVTISGSGFASGATVSFGGSAASSVSVNGSTSITATSPAGSGTVDVVVTNADGQSSAATSADRFTYTSPAPPPPAPAVAGVSPGSGPAAGGTSVTISGSGFASGATVSFGGSAASSVSVNGSTSITATSPAGSGTVDVVVTNADGQSSAATSADRFTYTSPPSPPVSNRAPVITGISPASGTTNGGDLVTLTGSNFTNSGRAAVSTVAFGGTPGSIQSLSDTQITVVTPAEGAGTVSVTATSSAGTSNGVQFTFNAPPPPPPPAPAVSSISPSHGAQAGGTTVTVTGSGFSGATAVRFGSTGASFHVDSDTQITASAPAEPAGTVDVQVSGPGGTSGTSSADRFTYDPATAPAPQPSDTAVTVQDPNRAEVSGTVNPDGQATVAYFEYGLDPKYSATPSQGVVYDGQTPAVRIPAGTSPAQIKATLTGLLPNATYHVRLIARASDGTTSAGPDQTFATPAGAPPPKPKLGKTENVAPASGVVLVDVGNGKFVPLTEARQIPAGAVLDTLKGSVLLTAAKVGGKVETGTFSGAVFKIEQTAKGHDKGITVLKLLEDVKGAPSLSVCNKLGARDGSGRQASAARKISRTILQILHARDHGGHFRTRGRYSAATARGTVWDTADRCDGTLTTVQQGSVLVNDLLKHLTKLVKAGQSYLASPFKVK